MADRLTLAQAMAAAGALALSAGSAAQALTDPTRPPLVLMSTAAAGAAPRTPLQSILLSSTRKGAIINGRYVALGGTYGKAKLVKITATEVTLKGDQGLEVLQLYPPLEKTSAASGTEGKPEKVVTRP
jgi:MSHA biogenesis protein MshK